MEPKKSLPLPWWLRVVYECMHCGARFKHTGTEEGEFLNKIFITAPCPYCLRKTLIAMPKGNPEELADDHVMTCRGGYQE